MSLDGCIFEGNRVGISIPKNSGMQIEVPNTKLINNGTAIEERDAIADIVEKLNYVSTY